MRVSTVTMYEQSTASINRQQNDFLKIGQQIASGRRVVNPSDDPQAASRAVGVDQSKAITQQYEDARVSARNSLAQTESILNSISDAVTSAKTLLIQASSDTLSDVDRESIASELKGVYETMIGQANATDGNGRYIFGGYKDNAPPFVKSATGSIEYNGDVNARSQRVDSSRLMPVTENGATIFQGVPSGAGYIANADVANQGSVTFSGPQVTSVNDPNYGESFRVLFDDDGAGNPTYTVEQFDGAAWQPVAGLEDQAYDPAGEQISFGGVSLTLKGAPQVGDEILVARPGSDQLPADLFRTMEAAIRVLETPAENDTQKAALRNTLNTSMRELDNSLDNVLTVRASAGARLNELDVIDAVGNNRMLNYEQTLSDLVDLDYADAISEYSLRQVGLQAAQKAFVDIKGMSLFDFM
ncbi:MULTISPECIES: flagellar hook-associated protein FlgL [unclassified Halomonas]|uniref:flagellar hook-associated protein FlgL n=1 Tax=unclassified Halomonas TaxID=2609666 RepID=UPI00111B1EF9|nr:MULTISPECIES: flagellar hook-associated protein FlgL [unclassified Halomonas]MCG7576838.1 flagellar hook-associated protein FlgL [Halomonas sp. MMH1-48]MCG7603901.1 flagellar hook-associated protein FlgL [Halomonas sp. MM17-34]MCG7613291.1 flagellar hook-associated protein FlgL [Halomonas sp. MM17-29]MCG7620066.1 flagellar hook-associated protein FlgL [Halomonas sp. DSH1-27]TNH15068.1 flagellar hook-associated protein 3 [Halomonas sp. BL6]